MNHQNAPSPLPGDTPGFEALAQIALDLRCSWNHAADALWRRLDPALWELTYNPRVVLRTVARARVERLLAEPDFRQLLDTVVQARQQMETAPTWFSRYHAAAPLTAVAYFSMEFMLSEALPIYSGGLGNVAGDQLKAASDLGVPVVGVGLLYQQGYFRQIIDKHGRQQALYPYNEPGQLPIRPLRQPNGQWLRIEIALPGYSVWLRAWQVRVGRTWLYLLDSNDAANPPTRRGITSELYGGGPELRLKQEILLGIGGWRLLEALGLNPEVCHLNEGHAAFAVLERAHSFQRRSQLPFAAALAATRVGNLFTTHTAVNAGFDRFPPDLIAQYLGRYARERLGIPLEELLALGRLNPADSTEPFNMAYLALRGSGAVNGVSRLHGQVSRSLFAPLFPRWPLEEVPVMHVTNGVHMPSWDSAAADEFWTSACGPGCWLCTTQTENLERGLGQTSDEDLWRMRTVTSRALAGYVRQRLAAQWAAAGASPQTLAQVDHVFDPDALILGFARRFATYKRPNLLLHHPDRLAGLLNNARFPVQLIVAGKAHPADAAGQQLIEQWVQFVRRPDVRRHAVFLEDYDMLLTERLVQGVDVWINTPRRPWEASGTSGMKVLVNGGLNLSTLDGWWAEAFAPDVGWAIGDGREHGDDPAWDAADAEQLYDLLEHQIIPEFYARDAKGIPTAWVGRMRRSMARLTPCFSADRTVREYTEKHYLPAAALYRARTAANGAGGEAVLRWRQGLQQLWPALRFGQRRVRTEAGRHDFEVQVYLGALPPENVQVELYANGVDGGPPVRELMRRGRDIPGAAGGYVYQAAVEATRPADDYTPRLVPHHVGVAVPLEASEILWQR